jgi:hypothetical protein
MIRKSRKTTISPHDLDELTMLDGCIDETKLASTFVRSSFTP